MCKFWKMYLTKKMKAFPTTFVLKLDSDVAFVCVCVWNQIFKAKVNEKCLHSEYLLQ